MDDDALVRALAEPATYPHAPDEIRHLQTHVSHVFLAGPYVYKLKKPVAFPFLDFSTRARRAEACREELRLNRRLSPAVYLDVLPLTRDDTGRVRLGGPGEPLDHVVWMRRLPAGQMLPALVARDAFTPAMVDALAAHLAAFHARADTGPALARYAEPARLETTFRDTMAAAAPFAGTLAADVDLAIVADFGATFVRRHETLLRARQQAGRIRDGHGDLHAEHVCFVDAPVPAPHGEPLAPGIYVFDCLEFSTALRACDVAAEIAFTVMDLDRLGRRDLARQLAAAYIRASGDDDVALLLPYYVCTRACVRGVVEALATRDAGLAAAERTALADRARQHFALALRAAWQAGGPSLVLCGGPSGSGKTTLAAALAAATGFVHLQSDVVRKERAGVPLDRPAPATAYTPEARAANYAALADAAAQALAAGHGAIVDATFLRRADRERVASAATRRGRPWVLVACDAPDAVVRARLRARDGGSVSDARWDTYLAQRAHTEPLHGEPCIAADCGSTLEASRATALRALWAWSAHGRLGS
jgi:uncharacterized protein